MPMNMCTNNKQKPVDYKNKLNLYLHAKVAD